MGNSTLNLVTVTSTPKEQPFYVGMTGFAYGSGCILGPIVGGSLADSSATWRWVSVVLVNTNAPAHVCQIGFLPQSSDFRGDDSHLLVFAAVTPATDKHDCPFKVKESRLARYGSYSWLVRLFRNGILLRRGHLALERRPCHRFDCGLWHPYNHLWCDPIPLGHD